MPAMFEAISESLRGIREHVYAGGSIRAAADRILRAAEAAGQRAPLRRSVALAAEEAS